MYISSVMSSGQMAGSERGEGHQYSNSPATRHLCAGVYLQRRFRDLVISRVHNDSRRRVAPSYGFDLVPVVRHAWRAWLLDVGEHVAIAGCLLAGLVRGSPLAVVLVGCAMALCWVVCKQAAPLGAEVYRLHLEAWREQFRRRNPPGRSESAMARLRKRRRVLKRVLAGCVVIAASPMLVANTLHASLGDAAPAAAATGCCLVASAAVAGMLRQFLLNAVYHAGSLRPLTLTGRERTIDEQQSHPCVVYQRLGHHWNVVVPNFVAWHGVPTTFVGSGRLVRRWLLAVQFLRPGNEDMGQREYTSPPFAAHQLVERLRSGLGQVGLDVGPEALRGLRVRDRVYVAEPDVSCDRSLLRGDLNEPDLWNIIDDHESAGQHFLEISVPIDGGELVTTVFVRVTVKARCLSLYIATCALTRTPAGYQLIDAFAEHGTGAVLRRAVGSVCCLPAELWQLWRLLEIPVVVARALWASRDRTLVPRRGRTVGARVAVREEVADYWRDAHLDSPTIHDHRNIIEGRIFKITEDFLDAHNVDTSAFRKQATNIINNSGVFTTGGTTEIKDSPIGTGARVDHYVDDSEAKGESE